MVCYKCKCKECGLVFDSYVKVDLCMKHYWEDRDAQIEYLKTLNPDEITIGKPKIIDLKPKPKKIW